MGEFLQDLRVGARQLARRPGFAAAAILSLALGVGVNTTLFTIVNAVLFKSSPVADPARLVEIYSGATADLPQLTTSYPDYLDVRAEVRAFEGRRRPRLRARRALDRRQAAARHRRGGHGQLLRRARRAPAARPRVPGRRGGRTRRRAGRRRQPRTVAAPARRAARRRRHDGEALGPRLHRDRRRAGGVPRHGSGHSHRFLGAGHDDRSPPVHRHAVDRRRRPRRDAARAALHAVAVRQGPARSPARASSKHGRRPRRSTRAWPRPIPRPTRR